MRVPLLLLSIFLVPGCAIEPASINRAPELSRLGASLDPFPNPSVASVVPAAPRLAAGSTTPLDGAGLFRNTTAARVGDILTVEVALDDSASLDSRSDRARDSDISLGVSLGFDNVLNLFELTGGGTIETASASSAAGRGAVDRAERLDLTVAAVVTAVLPNGNLVIEGTQEVLVNNEMRMLRVAGLVRPADIDPDNRVDYRRMAEARLAYGGRGRIAEIQQPPYGQQIYDAASPL